MQADHLRPVPGSGENGDGGTESSKKARARSRPRAGRPLPTDRLKFDAQVDALKAIATASGYGKESVSAEDIAPYLGIATATAGLNNAFFLDSGLIVRESKGRYKPTEAVNTFARDHGFNPQRAAHGLADTLSRTWYFQTVLRRLDMGKTTRNAMIEALARAAGASSDHQVQLSALLSWLEFAGLISTDNGDVRVLKGAPVDTSPETAETPETPEKEHAGDTPDHSTGESATAKEDGQRERQPESILSFSFDFSLTASDLQELSPEQIQAVFEAVGKVMAIKRTI